MHTVLHYQKRDVQGHRRIWSNHSTKHFESVLLRPHADLSDMNGACRPQGLFTCGKPSSRGPVVPIVEHASDQRRAERELLPSSACEGTARRSPCAAHRQPGADATDDHDQVRRRHIRRESHRLPVHPEPRHSTAPGSSRTLGENLPQRPEFAPPSRQRENATIRVLCPCFGIVKDLDRIVDQALDGLAAHDLE